MLVAAPWFQIVRTAWVNEQGREERGAAYDSYLSIYYDRREAEDGGADGGINKRVGAPAARKLCAAVD